MYLLREPLLVIAAFLILFVTVLIYVRLDFSIAPAKAGKPAGANTSGILESVFKRHAKRAVVYETYDASLEKLKKTKDVSSFQATLKNITADHKTETQAINDLYVKCRNENPDMAEK